MRSILEGQSEISLVDRVTVGNAVDESFSTSKDKRSRLVRNSRQRDIQYAEVLSLFAELIGCKGRAFGQLNRPIFGMSDGCEGVQWNIVISSETGETRLGVNLEGMKYKDWPIANFLLNEVQKPQIFDVCDRVVDADQIFLMLARDAWQATARPNIIEGAIGVGNIALRDIDSDLWNSMLAEALTCLSKESGYRGRARQDVTLKGRLTDRRRSMEVSPHLSVWTPIATGPEIRTQMKVGLDRLAPIHDWISRASMTLPHL